jgi:hypothetical protein
LLQVSGKATTVQAAPAVPKNRVLPKKDHDAFKQLVVRVINQATTTK